MISSGLAPGNHDTLRVFIAAQQFQDQEFHRISNEVLNHEFPTLVSINNGRLFCAMRAPGRGSAPDFAGMRYEHMRVPVEDAELWSLFQDLTQDFARARVPTNVLQSLRLGHPTVLRKKDGGIPGIVAGSVLRRSVCRTVAAQFGDDFHARIAPCQFALQIFTGTDVLAHAVRVFTDLEPEVVVASLGGIRVFDHVKGTAFFNKFIECEEVRPLFSFVAVLSRDEQGPEHCIEQQEGGEQGCSRMPALHALAQHDALQEVSDGLVLGEHFLNFLNGLHVGKCKTQAAEVITEVAGAVERLAGARGHTGKSRAWCEDGGPAPPSLHGWRPGVWTADLWSEDNGSVIVGTPLGRPAFIETHV